MSIISKENTIYMHVSHNEIDRELLCLNWNISAIYAHHHIIDNRLKWYVIVIPTNELWILNNIGEKLFFIRFYWSIQY